MDGLVTKQKTSKHEQAAQGMNEEIPEGRRPRLFVILDVVPDQHGRSHAHQFKEKKKRKVVARKYCSESPPHIDQRKNVLRFLPQVERVNKAY